MCNTSLIITRLFRVLVFGLFLSSCSQSQANIVEIKVPLLATCEPIYSSVDYNFLPDDLVVEIVKFNMYITNLEEFNGYVVLKDDGAKTKSLNEKQRKDRLIAIANSFESICLKKYNGIVMFDILRKP